MKADFGLRCIVAVGSGSSREGVRASTNCKNETIKYDLQMVRNIMYYFGIYLPRLLACVYVPDFQCPQDNQTD